MQNNIKKTTEQFKKEVHKLVGNEYIILGEYKTNSSKILIKHNTCKNTYEVTPGNFLNGKRCPFCFGNKKLDFEKELEKIRPNEFQLLTSYNNKKTNVKVKHLKSGYIWDVSPRDLLNGKECPVDAKIVNKMDTELFKIKLKKIHPHFEVLGEYFNRETPILIKDTKHNYKFEARPMSVMKKSFKGLRSRIQEDKQILYEDFVKNIDSDYTVIGRYKNSKEKILMKHLSCGREFEMRPNDFQQGYRCPICANNGKSKMEQELKEYIRSIYSGKIIENYNDTKEIDIYIPEKKIGIEFDGLYWHSNLEKESNYHIEKTEYFKKKGIRLIHVFEDEWLYKRNIVENKLKHILKLSDSPRIYARKCNIKKIDTETKRDFLEKNHIQGSDRSNVKLGLYYKEELAAVMTFGSNRVALGGKSLSQNYELIRYAAKIDYIIIGGFSKLLNYFKKNYDWEKITTYADYRWSSDDNVYEKIGFVKLRLTKPNYWYFHNSNKIRYHRYSYRKQILKEKYSDYYDEGKTEKEIAESIGLLHIYDCGNIVYEMIKEKD